MARFWCAAILGAVVGASAAGCRAHRVSPAADEQPPARTSKQSSTPDAELPALTGSSMALEAGTQTPPVDLCEDPGDVLLFASPERPARDRPLHVVAVTERSVDALLTVTPLSAKAPAGSVPNSSSMSTKEWDPIETRERRGGPPFFWITQIDSPSPGRMRLLFDKDARCGGATLATKEIVVGPRTLVDKPRALRTSLWITRRAWRPAYENLYDVWIAHLFDAPLEIQPSWSELSEVLADRSRNFLYDHLGAAEDEHGMSTRPDCADLPYFLRAYFSFKLGLPFGWSHCSRGDSSSPPHCTDFSTNEDPFPATDAGTPALPTWADPARPGDGPWENNVKRIEEFFRTTLADAAQSGAGRIPAEDEESDYYPIGLSADTLRPGTIFGDPYGHVLVVSDRVAQQPPGPGVLLAVDAQPDGTVARKRFWRGNFLFEIDPVLGSPGFKRFRPIVRDLRSGRLRRAKNVELADFSSTDQYGAGVAGFYDKVEDVLSPALLDPLEALLSTIQALDEQVRTRVLSVDNGRKFLSSPPRNEPVAEMPDGEKIFETTGAWEDFSTPSRDLRLLIAIDVARSFPANLTRRPQRYLLPPGKNATQLRADLEARLELELRQRTFSYVRTDGSEWKLTLRDVVDRQGSLEMAYNPNDCVERRWGAPDGSDEASTCRARAPSAQVEKMAGYRDWFHERRRPPR